MGFATRLIQRRKKLKDDVTDNVPGREKVEKRDEILNDSPGAYGLMRGLRRRFNGEFGKEVLNRKIELAWEVEADIDRFDFGGSDFGLRITLPSSAQLLARGIKEEDELRIIDQSSVLAALRFSAVEEANSGDVGTGRVRLVDATTLRLPDGIVSPAQAAVGTIALDSDMLGSDLNDTETFTLDDGVNPALVFEFDLSAGGITGDVAVEYENADDADTLALAIRDAINGAAIDISASVNGSTVNLTNDTAGVAGNVVTTETVTSPKLVVSGMAGGADSSTTFASESSILLRVEISAGARL